MNKRRIKITNPIQTREALEREVGEIARLKIQEAELTARMDAEINQARKRYEEQLAAIDESVTAKMLMAQGWAEENPDAFGKLKSIDLLHAKIGWRTGQPTVKTAKGWTWKKVLDLLLRRPSLAKYIRSTPQINKDMILEDRKNMTVDTLLCIGMRIEQAETFYVEPKVTEVETRETARA